jgi:hypothetical protein
MKKKARKAIIKMIMKLNHDYGIPTVLTWKYCYNTFVNYDLINKNKTVLRQLNIHQLLNIYNFLKEEDEKLFIEKENRVLNHMEEEKDIIRLDECTFT